MKQSIIFFLKLMVSFALNPLARAATPVKPLPADQAFQMAVSIQSANQLQVKWEIAPGYYLYRDKFRFYFSPKTTADIQIPQGHLKLRSSGKQEEVYANQLSVPITLHGSQSDLKLQVSYQGCAEQGFCYPPIEKTISLQLGNDKAAPVANVPQSFSLQSLLTNQNSVRTLFESQSLFMMLMLFAGIGLLLAFTPCVFPMIPILTSIIVGSKQPVTTQRAFFLSLTYVLGAACTYAVAGLAAAYLGRSLQVFLQQPWIIVLFSGVFMLLALSLFGVYELSLPHRLQNRIAAMSRQQQGGSYLGVLLMGMVSTLIVSPCVTAPLIGVLMYIAESGNPVLGASALFVMSLGMGIPLIAIGVSAGKWLPKRGAWMLMTQKIFGLLMIGMAFWLLSRVTLPAIAILFCAACLMIGGFYFWLTTRSSESRFTHQTFFALSLVVIALVSTKSIYYFKMQPGITQAEKGNTSFKLVKNLEEISQQLLLAKMAGKPVLLDFFADWCESCIVMDKTVFSLPTVMQQLSPFIMLRADLSENNANDEAILKQYEVIAPPTVLFFNNQGIEVNAYRIVGELDAKAFVNRVGTFFAGNCDKRTVC
jgi:thioredoxin:protein disulfide reductase